MILYSLLILVVGLFMTCSGLIQFGNGKLFGVVIYILGIFAGAVGGIVLTASFV